MTKGTGNHLACEGEHDGEDDCVSQRNSNAGATGRKGDKNTWGQHKEEDCDIQGHIHLL